MAKECGYENNFLGVGEYRVKFIGHGIGLELDELPVLADNDAKLEENMVLTIEPKIVTSEGGVGVEDTILITKKGAKTLTNSERGMGV
jgi:Xaa-Pro aminopeptidase